MCVALSRQVPIGDMLRYHRQPRMFTTCRHVPRLMLVPCVALAIAACAPGPGPLPASLRNRTFALVSVDGRPVRGDKPEALAPDSRSARAECQDEIADGTLVIGRDGRSFTYRSSMRDCAGRMLLDESNDGTVESRNGVLSFVIQQASGQATFRGAFTDSTVTVFELGGRLEFARP